MARGEGDVYSFGNFYEYWRFNGARADDLCVKCGDLVV